MATGDGWSSDELAGNRSWTDAWMPGTCYLLTNAGTVNSIGGQENSWGTVGTVSCRVRPMPGQSAMEGAKQESNAADSEWEIVVPVGTTVNRKQRAKVAGVVYHIIAVVDDKSDNPDKRLRVVRRD